MGEKPFPYRPGQEAVEDLNRTLAEGWQVLCSHPMGGTAGNPEHPRLVSLVILTF